jgi:hypothetical protein
MFYFLWLGDEWKTGPFDNTQILAKDPDALNKPDSPLWGPRFAPHHWGESLFGYYQTKDPYVLRKHAQMLADAGVDTLVFDVTNQLTYKDRYLALLKAFSQIRREGGRTPQVAFLCPFWDPNKVVQELYKDLYEPGLYRDLWFRWEGKPLILADPALVEDASQGVTQWNTPAPLESGHTLAQSFTSARPFRSVALRAPTWETTGSAATLTLRRGGPGGESVASRRFTRVEDNSWLALPLRSPLPPGTYYLEMSAPLGRVGWWSHSDDLMAGGEAYADGRAAPGDRSLRVNDEGSRTERIRSFFTFRKPQPDYFRGPTAPDMWSWLEVYPQHVFLNSQGVKEQMSVGVAQNAVGNRLGSMSETNAKGRSFHAGAVDTRPGAVNLGLNFAEQWRRALKEDPRFVFVTGWNEWIAGRFDDFGGVKLPVMFPDEFDEEHSRDIEPMKGGYGDSYYYQLVSFIRRYKGVRKPTPAGAPRTISLDRGFTRWRGVQPEYRDDFGDTAWRDYPGFNNHTRYVNRTGRNDILAAKVTHDSRFVYFYVRTRDPITPRAASDWMTLLLDTDRSHATGWEGYELAVNRVGKGNTALVERNVGGKWAWKPIGRAEMRLVGRELQLAVPIKLLPGITRPGALALDFKWADNATGSGDILDFTTRGDVAPNGRFNYRYVVATEQARRRSGG